MWRPVERRPTGQQSNDQYVRSYIGMRFLIGLLALALPPLLVVLEPLLFDGQPAPRGSLSAYYYSGLREVFVGGVAAIGVFLITYKLVQRSLENLFSIFAGIAAIVVALFPTGRPGKGVTETPFQVLLGERTVELIHYGAAIVFIGLLAVISVLFGWFGRRARGVHYACASAIVLAGGLCLYSAGEGGFDKGILIGEWAAVWAFAISWLTTVEFRLLFRSLG